EPKRSISVLRFRAASIGNGGLEYARTYGSKLRRSCSSGRAWFEAPHHRQPEIVAPSQSVSSRVKSSQRAERESEIKILSHLKAEKAGRRHTYDFHRAFDQKLARDCRVAAPKLALPKSVTN